MADVKKINGYYVKDAKAGKSLAISEDNKLQLLDSEESILSSVDIPSREYTLEYIQDGRQLTLKEDGTAVSTIDLGFAVPATRLMIPGLVKYEHPSTYEQKVVWTIGDGTTFALADGTYVFYYGDTHGKPIKLDAAFDSNRSELALTAGAFRELRYHDGCVLNTVNFMPRGDNLYLDSSFSGAGVDLYANRNTGFDLSTAGNKLRKALLTDPANVSYNIYKHNGDFYMTVEVKVVLASTDSIQMPNVNDEILGIRVDTKTVAIGLSSVDDIPDLPAELQALL